MRQAFRYSSPVMESYQVLKEAIGKVGVKSVAADIGLSQSLVYKWCQPKGDEESGADNPLDRLAKVYECTGDTGLAQWLCEKMDGTYVPNTSRNREAKNLPLVTSTQHILNEFSTLLQVVSASIENDGMICTAEAKKIRREWEELKSTTEQFVRACEDGIYHDDSDD